jgi:hypothetical protein
MASSIWPISVDKLYFENSLINLCINARDATEEHGQITLTAENVLLKRASHAGDYVMISVADNGMGMSEEIKARIFDMFFTTKPEGKGAGLGLPMVKNFMDHVQGLIEVESTPGLGTIVSLYFPRTAGLPQSPQAYPGGPAETILLIEPDLATRNAMAQVLYGLGYQVVTAYLPEVALRYINSGMKVDLIIAADEFSGALSIAKMQEKAGPGACSHSAHPHDQQRRGRSAACPGMPLCGAEQAHGDWRAGTHRTAHAASGLHDASRSARRLRTVRPPAKRRHCSRSRALLSLSAAGPAGSGLDRHGCCQTLAQRLIQAHPAGNRHIQAFHRTLHGDADQRIAGLAGQLAHAIALGPSTSAVGPVRSIW